MPEVFAQVHVADYAAARPWYERLFGTPPTFEAHATECVWTLAEQGHVAIAEDGLLAGHSAVTIFTEDLDATTGAIESRGLDPVKRETYSNGVRKVTFCDADGNEIGFGGAPSGGEA